MKNSYIGQAWLVLALALCFGAALAGVESALKDRIEPDHHRALRLLDDAIRQRAEVGLSASPWYHFNRAVCVVELARRGELADPARRAQTLSDLEIARRNVQMTAALAGSPRLLEWEAEQADALRVAAD